MKTRIVVADDHGISAEALARCLNQVPEFQVVGVADEFYKVVPAVHRTSAAVLVVGYALVTRLTQIADETLGRLPCCGVTLIAGKPHHQLCQGMAPEQVSVVSREARLTELVAAIRAVTPRCRERARVPEPVPAATTGDEALLNAREQEILRSTVTGATIKEIARELYLAPGTVRNLASSAIKKLDARNRFDAARIAGEHGWI